MDGFTSFLSGLSSVPLVGSLLAAPLSMAGNLVTGGGVSAYEQQQAQAQQQQQPQQAQPVYQPSYQPPYQPPPMYQPPQPVYQQQPPAAPAPSGLDGLLQDPNMPLYAAGAAVVLLLVSQRRKRGGA